LNIAEAAKKRKALIPSTRQSIDMILEIQQKTAGAREFRFLFPTHERMKIMQKFWQPSLNTHARCLFVIFFFVTADCGNSGGEGFPHPRGYWLTTCFRVLPVLSAYVIAN